MNLINRYFIFLLHHKLIITKKVNIMHKLEIQERDLINSKISKIKDLARVEIQAKIDSNSSIKLNYDLVDDIIKSTVYSIADSELGFCGNNGQHEFLNIWFAYIVNAAAYFHASDFKNW